MNIPFLCFCIFVYTQNLLATNFELFDEILNSVKKTLKSVVFCHFGGPARFCTVLHGSARFLHGSFFNEKSMKFEFLTFSHICGLLHFLC
jgi:hypothetical protein